ncbi:hypothetical protein C4J95_0720 [Pseudomonas orientalis]|uniref:hypothetical protein n=1 Tax=Pseudomonas orientalis TaxID=76758 RepID=UPI000F582F3B|nr:hypothetical protein [Pseudomonas orientalis]AZE92851.1 hypothetical protein C4J96_0711 [Pseudomonas orientalis]AZE98204.1 hypothetical protein C4J95_0720 [Pseudomonas orientalis]
MISKIEWAPETRMATQENGITTASSTSSLDSHFFSSELAVGEPVRQGAPAIGMHFLAEQSVHLKQKFDAASKGLNDLVKKNHSIKSAQVPQALVESKEILTVAVKIIKHCSSMIEKTTNLQ